MPPPRLSRTERSSVRRKADRGRYDWDTMAAILDEALICHVGFAVGGRPWVVPTAFARVDDHVYLHGAVANFALRTLAGGADACVTVTLLDGLVLSRSAFHHSMNYRSVMLFGPAATGSGCSADEWPSVCVVARGPGGTSLIRIKRLAGDLRMRRRRLDVYRNCPDWPGKNIAWRSEQAQYDRYLIIAAQLLEVPGAGPEPGSTG